MSGEKQYKVVGEETNIDTDADSIFSDVPQPLSSKRRKCLIFLFYILIFVAAFSASWIFINYFQGI